MPSPLPRTLLMALLVTALVTAACSTSPGSAADELLGPTTRPTASAAPPSTADIARREQTKGHLKRLDFIVKASRSFDNSFGTFPGAEGIPMRDGRPSVGVPDPNLRRCVPPYRTIQQLQEGG